MTRPLPAVAAVTGQPITRVDGPLKVTGTGAVRLRQFRAERPVRGAGVQHRQLRHREKIDSPAAASAVESGPGAADHDGGAPIQRRLFPRPGTPLQRSPPLHIFDLDSMLRTAPSTGGNW